MCTTTLSMLALVGVAHSHMSLFYPPPLGGAPSINKESSGALDTEFNYPLGCCGPDGGPSRPSPGICRGHLDKFDTETAQVTWQPGQDAYFQLTDYSYDPNAPGGTHYGGSCQVGFSIDRGETWKMAASYHGACPHYTEDGSPEAQTFDFKVPTGMPEGPAIFSWVWLNREHESFVNCAKVNIGSGSSNSSTPSTPTSPSSPSQSASRPQRPAQSAAQPLEPDEEEPETPTTESPGSRITTTTTAVTTIYIEPTGTPDDTQDEENFEDNTEDTDSPDGQWWRNRPHRKVQEGARRYQVDGAHCECRRDEFTLAARCSCDTTDSAVERKALRLHRRTFYKRVDACDWNSAPVMETSYYTEDAKCAPNAKQDTPESDTFEIRWDVSCGVVEGSEYPLKTMICGNSFSASFE
ncbi:hypothetical protein ACN47E_006601 [Coniothyrium glycines]